MYPDDGKAEIRRLQLMASTPLRRRRARKHRAKGLPIWLLPMMIVMVIALAIIGAIITDRMLPPHPHTAVPVTSTRPLGYATQARGTSGPTTDPNRDPQESRALAVKPLEDIELGDRVIYRDQVCTWHGWNKDITKSTILCPDKKLGEFTVATARLTPVERADNP